MKNFAMVGAAGFVAPRHMRAISENGGRLIAATDPNDSVGILDSFFPHTEFFTEFEHFDRFIHMTQRKAGTQEGEPIDYLSVCSPNYLHDAHIRFGLRSGCDVICEKPLVINPWNIDGIEDLEKELDNSVNTILQLRLHPSVKELRQEVQKKIVEDDTKKFDVDLVYITSRGSWYLSSWKGVEDKSGGIVLNIGVHFFDMLHFVFGDLQDARVYLRKDKQAAGYLEFQNARVRWFLSTDENDLPAHVRDDGKRTFRSLLIGENEFEFSSGFTDLHTASYAEVLGGRGFSISDARPSIEAVHLIRNKVIVAADDMTHPLAKKHSGS